jgi:hypothetical protein
MVIDTTKINIEELSDTYYRIAELIGLNDAIRLSNELTGLSIRFRKKFDLDNIDNDYPEIVACIGQSKAKKLLRGFSGEHVYFSSMRSALKKQVRDEISREFKGYNCAELAKRFGYSENGIRNIARATPSK